MHIKPHTHNTVYIKTERQFQDRDADDFKKAVIINTRVMKDVRNYEDRGTTESMTEQFQENSLSGC